MTRTMGQRVQAYVDNNVLTDGKKITWQGRPDPKEEAKVGWLTPL